MRRRHIIWLLSGTAALTLAGVPLAAFAGQAPQANLRLVTPGGAFLANIDDDANKCQAAARKITEEAVAREEDDEERFEEAKQALLAEPDEDQAELEYVTLRRAHRLEQNLADRQMAACNDAADEVVANAADERDLTRLRVAPWAGASADAAATLAVTGNVRLFVKRARWEVATRLTAAELRTGVELGLEGRDVVRDSKVWDGGAVVTLSVTAGGQTTTQSVRMHAAPVLTQLNTQKLQRVLIAADDDGWQGEAAAALPAGVATTRLTTPDDAWTQDLFEPGYQVMPGPDGRPHGMRVLIPSINELHRQSARVAYTELRGPDVAVVHVPGVPIAGVDDANTYDSMGNVETMPPTPGHPHGTIVIGGTPSPEIVTFFRSQRAQDVVMVDTGWLSVGHVDEFIQFLPTPDGWRAIVADPQAGLDLVGKVKAAGHGGDRLHGKLPELEYPDSEYIDQRTVNQFLADTQFVETNRAAARKIDENLAELGLGPDRVVRVPTLATARDFDWYMAAQELEQMSPGPERDEAEKALTARRAAAAEIPNVVNGLVAGPGRYVAPKTFGPLLGGADVFTTATDQALKKLGYQATYVDDLVSAHLSGGEIHCSTNTFRDYLN